MTFSLIKKGLTLESDRKRDTESGKLEVSHKPFSFTQRSPLLNPPSFYLIDTLVRGII